MESVVYVVEMTDPRSYSDGWLAFNTEVQAKVYVDRETSGRSSSVPDEYISYDLIGYRECTPAFLGKVTNHVPNAFYFHRFGDLKSTVA